VTLGHFSPQKSLGWGFAFVAYLLTYNLASLSSTDFFSYQQDVKIVQKTKTPSPRKVSKKCHLEMGFATKYSLKNYSSGVTLNSEFFCWRDFMEHSFILTLACLKQCWGVTWFCQL
jgi:hypothetical protein